MFSELLYLLFVNHWISGCSGKRTWLHGFHKYLQTILRKRRCAISVHLHRPYWPCWFWLKRKEWLHQPDIRVSIGDTNRTVFLRDNVMGHWWSLLCATCGRNGNLDFLRKLRAVIALRNPVDVADGLIHKWSRPWGLAHEYDINSMPKLCWNTGWTYTASYYNAEDTDVITSRNASYCELNLHEVLLLNMAKECGNAKDVDVEAFPGRLAAKVALEHCLSSWAEVCHRFSTLLIFGMLFFLGSLGMQIILNLTQGTVGFAQWLLPFLPHMTGQPSHRSSPSNALLLESFSWNLLESFS